MGGGGGGAERQSSRRRRRRRRRRLHPPPPKLGGAASLRAPAGAAAAPRCSESISRAQGLRAGCPGPTRGVVLGPMQDRESPARREALAAAADGKMAARGGRADRIDPLATLRIRGRGRGQCGSWAAARPPRQAAGGRRAAAQCAAARQAARVAPRRRGPPTPGAGVLGLWWPSRASRVRRGRGGASGQRGAATGKPPAPRARRLKGPGPASTPQPNDHWRL
jgi:hypothetical protein